MSTKKKFKADKTVYPVGVAVHPKLDMPYYFDEKAQKSVPDPGATNPKSDMNVQVAYTEEEAAPLIKAIKDYAVREGFDLDDVKNWPFKKEKDRNTKQFTGRVLFKWKAYAKTMENELNHVPHFDAQLTKLPKGFKVTGGSQIRPKGRILAFDVGAQNGVRLLLEAVQVLSRASFEANADGFDAQDGYVGDTDAPTNNNDQGEPDYAAPNAEVHTDKNADF